MSTTLSTYYHTQIPALYKGRVGRGIIIFLFLLLSFHSAHAALILQRPNYTGLNQGLVGYWSFDGKDTTSTTATDRSGNNNNGTLTNGPLPVQGKIGQALSFDGVDDEVTTSNFFVNPQTFSISVWFKTTSASGKKLVGFESSQTGTGSTSYDRHIYMGTDGKIYFGWYPGSTVTVISSATLNNGQWHHAVGTHNGSTGILYIDGVSQGSNTGSPQSLNGWWRIGAYKLSAWTNASDGYFPGQIDDVRIYNRALNGDEIKRLYKIGGTLHTNVSINTDSLQKGLVGYWSFDGKDTTSTTATDRSGNNNNGTLTNGPLPVQGKIGQALQLDGSNDYVTADGVASFIATGSVTFSAWINFRNNFNSSNATRMSVFRLGDAPSDNDLMFGFSNAASGPDGKLYLNRYGSGSWGNAATAKNSWNGGTWYFIVGTFAAGDQKIYVNGVQDGSATLGARGSTASTHFTLGSNFVGESPTGYFDGKIDDVRIYNRVLSADEIKRLYKIGGTLHVNTSNVGNNDTLKNGLVGYWTFDGNDTTSTTATDRSGNGNNGTLTNGPLPAQGKIGQALSFDGVDDIVRDLAAVGIPNKESPQSISAWFTTTNIFTGIPQLILLETGGSGNGIELRDGTIRYARYGNVILANSGLSPTVNTWYHVVATWDGTTNRIYINGVENGSTTVVHQSGVSTSIRIGNDSGGDSWGGKIDDVRIYNRALTTDEIKRLYNLGR